MSVGKHVYTDANNIANERSKEEKSTGSRVAREGNIFADKYKI